MRILFLSPRESWPPNSGAKLRDYHFARGLAQHNHVTYIFFGREDAASALREHLGPDVYVRAVSPASKYTASKILKGIFGSHPLPVVNYTSPEMAAALGECLTRETFDLVHLDSLHMAGYVSQIMDSAPAARLVLNWHNIESEGMRRFARTTDSLRRRIYAGYTARRLATLENSLLASCHGHVVCSARERDLLTDRNALAHVEVIENGVDTTYFTPNTGSVTNRLVFVGQMSYFANIDGITWFADEIWPGIQQRFPGMELSIVGADPPAAVRALAHRPGIHVTGTVADLRPYYAHAFAAIVPLRTGAGTRLKILEAMAAGAPVISTALGAEGLEVTSGRDILIADNPEAWIRALEIVSDTALRSDLVTSARNLVSKRYDWAMLGCKLEELYRSWLSI